MQAAENVSIALTSVEAEASQAVAKDSFLAAMRRTACPVSVVTTSSGCQRMALTISSFLSVSAEPPLISVCINRNSRMHEAMAVNKSFAVHVLASDQSHVADVFAGRPKVGDPYDFACVDWIDQGGDREPLMAGVSVAAECVVSSIAEVGTHCLFIGAVRSLVENEKPPLLYWDRRYVSPSA